MSDTILVAIITLFASVGSVTISELIKNRQELKLKSIEIEMTIKREAINNFIDVTLDVDSSFYNRNEFYKALNKLIPYIDEKSSKYIGKIKKMFEDGCSDKEINSELLKLTMYLNDKSSIKSIK